MKLVCIHGAGLGSYIWDNIHVKIPVVSIDFPKRNKDCAGLSFDDYVTSTINQIKAEKMIIVTHSIGGCVGLRVAEHFGDKVVGFIGVAAAIPSEGSSFVSCLPYPQRLLLPLVLKLGTRPPDKAIAKGLGADLTPRQLQIVIDNFTPESSQLFTEKCNAPVPQVQSWYIKTTKDKEFTNAMQEKMARQLGAQTYDLDSGHLPMLSHAKELSTVLNEIIDQIK